MPADSRPSPAWKAALLTLLLLLHAAVRADTLSEDDIKAGFIFNFVKYAQWPGAALRGGELRVCGLGTQALAGKLSQLQGRQIMGREIQVRTSPRPDEWRNCNLLFIPDGDQQRVDTVLRAVAQAPVLTVGDSDDFAQSGGIIGLKQKAGRIRFDINLGAARRAGLTLSSQLLKLADVVVE
jgi:hypothetical protein